MVVSGAAVQRPRRDAGHDEPVAGVLELQPAVDAAGVVGQPVPGGRQAVDLDVVAVPAVEDVGAGPAQQDVVALAAEQNVGSGAADQDVVAGAAVGGEVGRVGQQPRCLDDVLAVERVDRQTVVGGL